MNIIACGINHKTASLELREKVYFSPEKTVSILQSLIENNSAREAVLLSTCNRTEIYCRADHHAPIIQQLAQHVEFDSGVLVPHSYTHYDVEAVSHAMRVASGLDSMVLGEPQILGQLKRAVSFAETQGACRHDLKRLFQHVFSAAKNIRTATKLGAKSLSFAYAVTFLAKRIFTDLTSLNILLIGAGETISQVARHLYAQKVNQIWISNRTLSKAKQLGHSVNAAAIDLSQMAHYLPQVDVVVCATASPIPILGKGAIERALKLRKHRPMLLVDLAVPRNIEGEVAELEDIYIYTLDHLQSIVTENFSDRVQAAKEAEKIVDIQTARFMRHLRALQAVDAIKTFRDKINNLQRHELARALKKLEAGVLPEDVLTQMSQRLANKFMHQPSVRLRHASAEGEFDVFEYMQQLFGLSHE